MFRKTLAVIGTLAAVSASLMLGSATAEASVIPKNGGYHGVDHGHRNVSFSFSGNQMTHFMVGDQSFGGAHVSNGMWHETCHNGFCTKGSWTSDGHVTGYWRLGSSHTWVSWTAVHQVPAPPSIYHGPYSGVDHHGTRIHLRFDGHVRSFQIGHTSYGDASVNHTGHFAFCTHTVCVQGHFQDRTVVVGHWRHAGSHTWIPWDANAYAY